MQVNRRRAAMVPPAPAVTPLAADPKFTEQFVLARHLVRHADSELLTSLSHVFGGTLRGKTLIEAAGNSGTKLITLLLDEAKKATGRDLCARTTTFRTSSRSPWRTPLPSSTCARSS